MSFVKIYSVLVVLLFIMLPVFVISLSAQPKEQKPEKVKINFSIGRILGDEADEEEIASMINLSMGKRYEVGINFLFWPKSFDDMVISGNFSFNFNGSTRIFPFITFGLGWCLCPELWLNYGIGIKARLKRNLGIRTEFHNWSCIEYNGGTYDYVLIGISYFI